MPICQESFIPCYVLDHTHPFSHGRTKERLHLYDATFPRIAAYRSRQDHVCQACYHQGYAQRQALLSYRHSKGCSRAKDRQSARAAMSNIVWINQWQDPICCVRFVCLFLCYFVAFRCQVFLCFCQGISPSRGKDAAFLCQVLTLCLVACRFPCIYSPIF